jgi:hypothetical protein
MALSNAEKSRRWRARKKAEAEARERYDRGLPEPPPDPVPPDGAYFTSGGHARPKVGHYPKADGTFPPIPEDIKAMTFTTDDGREELISEQYAQFLSLKREGAAPSDDRDVLFT